MGAAGRLVFRRFVYRKAEFVRCGARAADHVPPSRPLELSLEIVGAEAFDRILGSSPHLSASDVDRFRQHPSACIVVWDGDHIASSSWMTSGEVLVDELHRSVAVGPGEHFSCRSWVDPDYRGASLFGHMVAAYAASVPPDDLVWGLVLRRNVASLLTLQRLGWRGFGEDWTRFIGGRPVAGARQHPPELLVPDLR